MSEQRYRIAVLGDRDSVLGFKALGLDVYPAETAEEARPILHRLAREDTAILYLTEQLAAGLEAEIARYKDALTPAIILIPGKAGSLGIGMANVKKSVERAVGADIL
ncbi:MAG TPA: V-type ATP synthase subunit F [Candidatus Intestinimonas stercoravium]|uniref:V-type ATP synthase subunit F n=1 Tax=uncultured Intestinimonas sp. TaxID=1689265 RepID=UPI001F91D748|nr:V-type ATP synthase subunit F [uncultured Intestinimonas sp.]HJA64090.1 V-type ATP synthase subunit F [Candidatus Intestinimonas stercoravium]